ncbi:uncharacterized protein [Nicotiana tomentosiformis]|uniref:uncharacterized protein n=1 Tax=Nicotiana tomentosiformis TaxID=4098 RepID=UPI00388CD64F
MSASKIEAQIVQDIHKFEDKRGSYQANRSQDPSVPKSIITYNAANINSDLMKAMCEAFKIKHRYYTTYRPQMNGVVEAANKNIKKILRKMVDNYKQWYEKLPFALLGYRTMVRTSTKATPYLLVYGIEAVIPAEVEIISLRIIQEAELSDTK